MPSKNKLGAATPDPMEPEDGLDAATAGEDAAPLPPDAVQDAGPSAGVFAEDPSGEAVPNDAPTEEASAPGGDASKDPEKEPAPDKGAGSPPPEAPEPSIEEEPVKKGKKKAAAKKAAKPDEDVPPAEDGADLPPDPESPEAPGPESSDIEPDGVPAEDPSGDDGQTPAPGLDEDAAGQAIDDSLEPIQAPKAVKRPTAGGHKRIYDLKLNDLDRDLSAEQRQEWNDVYASFRSKTVLTGMALGVDHVPMSLRDKSSGEEERHSLNCMVVIQYRVKVLIPESEMWFPGAERPSHVMQNMVGGEIDYVIMDVDREGECAVASRRMALAARRHYFSTAPNGHQEGELLNCRVLAVGPKRCMVECAGHDITLSQRDLTYVSVPDLREKYHPGQTLPCILKEYDAGEARLVISVKEVNPNPFDGACLRHPINARRQATISGKYGGGVFCTLPDDTTVLCLYCAQHSDRDFQEGDSVIIAIKAYDYEKEQIFGRILAKW